MGLDAVAPPAAAVAARGGQSAAVELERDLAVGGLDTDRPGAAVAGDVAARVDEAGPCADEHAGDAVDGVALSDPAEVEAVARLELDVVAVHPDAASAGGGLAGGAVGVDLVERPVVACGAEGVVDGRVEQASGSLACLDGEPGDLDELGAGVEPAGAVERRELGVRAEARQQGFQPLELVLGLGEGLAALGARRCVQQELDLRSHCLERVLLHHDVLVIVSGGSVTTRTGGAE